MDDRAEVDPVEYNGYLIAWDPITAKPRWQKKLKGHWNGGILSTAGGLVFQGTADGRFTAYKDTNGEELWHVESTSGFFAPPVTYRIAGEQYVAIAAGIGGGGMAGKVEGAMINEYHNEGRIIGFKLGASETLPLSQERDLTLPVLPEIATTEEQIAEGKTLYRTYCSWCHGGGFLYPDLRYTSQERHAIFKEIVVDGVLVEQGMPSFGDVTNPRQAQAIQAHVLDIAAKLREEQALEIED